AEDQLALFDLGPPPSEARRQGVEPAAQPPEVEELGRRLPPGVHLGGSTWAVPGWAGVGWGRSYSPSQLGPEGLCAYARHPLFRGVGVDRTHYGPVEAAELAEYRQAVPPGFLFLVKAHEACTVARWPDHDRYGVHRGLPNPLFLDPAYAADQVVAPF